MFSHVMVGANDIAASKAFYDAVMAVLGHPEGVFDEKGRCFYVTPAGVFAITSPINGEVATSGNGMTIGFKASSPELVDAWHKAGAASGGTPCEEPPGVRGNGQRKLYLAYLRDPSGNKVCATHFVS
ncbi:MULTISPECIES: VOC family protein [Motilimonas]|uniref:VOC family protein n=1 Tax=Motilimonas cestriensis TaxID=2742685 RepID=A0ABS8W9L2_9GAMM|nr:MULTISPECIES: VOC family protein [Motilimonas]MCE0556384.1 VOC family protein [Motilimonas sp. E26]MCE2595704.1 VOC family protein [Motilimonas cestriensis]MDO6525846.1 VOC family protein [Motilimonas sp. 1_MG-2023]